MLNFFNDIVQEDMKDIYEQKILFDKLKNKSVFDNRSNRDVGYLYHLFFTLS